MDPAVGVTTPSRHLNRGGLPRSIWTQQSKNFSRSDVERNIVDGEEFAKLFDQTLHMQNGRGHECQSVTRVTATCELKSRADGMATDTGMSATLCEGYSQRQERQHQRQRLSEGRFKLLVPVPSEPAILETAS